MSEVASAYVSLLPSARGFGRKLESQVGGEVTSAGKRLGGMLAAGLAAAAGGGALAFITDTIGAASDLQQSVGGVEAVFGQYADEVEKDSARAAKALGLSKNAYNELITISGAMLKNKGLSNFAGQSEKLVNLGADLAATFGGTTREAVEALNAAFRGESDPIERYGVSLNESAVNAELAAKGQDKLKGAALDQAKAQARLNILFKQTKDAQGGAAREAGTFAAKQQQLTAAWENQRAEIGQNFLPVATSALGFLNDTAIPVVGATAHVVADLASAFGDLPGPVKTAAGALVAFKVAQATGLTGAASSRATAGLASVRSGMDSLRLRTMLAGDEYGRLRRQSLALAAATNGSVRPIGRMQASLGALRTATSGAGGGLRRGLAGISSLVGGPWGAAFIGATAIIGHFWAEQQKAKRRVDDLTASLDEQTGALTELSRKNLFETLSDKGAIEGAKALGIELDTLRLAAEGNAKALAKVRATIGGAGSGFNEVTRLFGDDQAAAAFKVEAGLVATGNALDGANQKWRDQQAFAASAGDAAATSGAKSAAAAQGAASATRGLAGATSGAAGAVRDLTAAQHANATELIKQGRGNIALRQTLLDVRKEAREGARTLDTHTQAGIDNKTALFDLADQWNQSNAEVRKANGGYRTMRRTFIELATQMGADKSEAKRLADQLLNIPDRKPKVNVQGIPKARTEVDGLLGLLGRLHDKNITITTTRRTIEDEHHAQVTGRTSPRVGATRATTAPDDSRTAGGRTRTVVQIGGREFEGYITELADDRIYANGALSAEAGRAL